LKIMLSGWRSANTLAVSLLVSVVAAACGGDDEGPKGAPPEVPIGDSGPLPPFLTDGGYIQPVGSPCTETDVKECKVLLPAHGPIHPCFIGVQICTNGKWGECIEPPDAGPAADGGVVN
jgi:hypothetical protein